jgi:hypothetical protein
VRPPTFLEQILAEEKETEERDLGRLLSKTDGRLPGLPGYKSAAFVSEEEAEQLKVPVETKHRLEK